MSIRSFRERSPAAIGVLSIIGLTLATTVAFYVDRIPAIKQAYTIHAEFADAAGLEPENQVRVAGLKVGTVTAVELAGDRVRATMEIDRDIRIPVGAFAEIKLATILGTKFVDLEAKGQPPFMEPGETIPLERTDVPYEIYQAANQGTSVIEDIDGGAVNEALVQLTKLTRAAKDEIGIALRGLDRLGGGLNAEKDSLRSLLSGAEDLTALLSGQGGNLVRLIDASNDVLASLARKREEVQSLLESTKLLASELTGLLRHNRGRIDSILVKLGRALKVLERDIEEIDVALEYMGPSTRYLGSVFTQGRWGDVWVCSRLLSTPCEADER